MERQDIMIFIGEFNSLKINRITRGGGFLDAQEEGELYLPKKEIPDDAVPGDTIEVFVYNESKEKLGATTREPFAELGEFAPMVVTSITDFGVFLEWGIPKDLFVPRTHLPERKKPHSPREHRQKEKLKEGDILVVYLTLDYEKRGVIGTTHLSSHFDKDTSALSVNQEVDLIVYEITKLGAQVIIDNRWDGLLYHGETFEPVHIGDRKKGYVKKVRGDGLVDAALQPQGFIPASREAEETILHALEKEGGFLPLHDKSPPDEVRKRLHMSKRLFKNTIGTLYRRGLLLIEEEGIRQTPSKSSDCTP
ncbi:MAG: S1 RNA-binding domain-containing protein [Spirochaetaceae bacterium]